MSDKYAAERAYWDTHGIDEEPGEEVELQVANPLGRRRDTTETPTPGSDAALALGCRCAVLDNAHGRGYMGVPGQYVINQRCGVHGSLGEGEAR